MGDWSTCPRGECPHAGVVHDWDGEPGTEVCCVDGCPCGQAALLRIDSPEAAAGQPHLVTFDGGVLYPDNSEDAAEMIAAHDAVWMPGPPDWWTPHG